MTDTVMTTTDTAYHCAICTRLIGKQATHYLTETDVVCCGWCLFNHQGTRPAHRVCYPDCPVDSHDMTDHTHLECPTRAALHRAIGAGGYHAALATTTPHDDRMDDR
jgi:hypothetical protein